MNTVFKLLESAIEPPNFEQSIAECYELLLDAGLHCNVAWQALLKYGNLEQLHYYLLLGQPRAVLRNAFCQQLIMKLERFSA